MPVPPAPNRPSFGSGYPSEPVVEHIMAQPGVQRVPSAKLSLFIRRALIPTDLCAALIDRIDAKRRPSTIADANGDPTFRTSETCELDPADPLVARLVDSIAELSGIPADRVRVVLTAHVPLRCRIARPSVVIAANEHDIELGESRTPLYERLACGVPCGELRRSS